MDVSRRVVGGADALPASLTMAVPVDKDVALYAPTQHHHRRRRLFGCGDENGNGGGYDRSPTNVNNMTLLVDELEVLRSENFQLRLRVYNAEQRVDELTAADEDRRAWCCRRCGGDRPCTASYSTDSDAGSSVDNDGEESSSSTAPAAGEEKAAVMAFMAKKAVCTISDLMTVNQRLMALLNAVLSAKPVAESGEDDRRWQTLRNQIKQYCDVGNLAVQGEKVLRQFDEGDEDDEEEEEEDDETDSEDERTEPIMDAEREATVRLVVPPVTKEPVSTAAVETSPAVTTVDTGTTANDGGSADDELVRLRARCQQLELSIQRLVNTELWARNRQIGKLEQQRCAAQQQLQQRQQRRDDSAPLSVASPPEVGLQQRSGPAATSTPVAAPKGILVQRPRRLQTASKPESRPAGHSVNSPPPVLPDYSEVNFFFSCDEEDEDRLDLGPDADNASSSSSSSSIGNSRKSAGDANNNLHDRPRRRQRRRGHHRHQHPNAVRSSTATPSSTESEEVHAAERRSNDGVATSTTAHRPPQAGSSSHRRPRLTGPSSGRGAGGTDGVGGDHVETHVPSTVAPAPVAVADAQVQCDHVNADDLAQVQQLRRELEARRRENSRLYEMLLKLQRKEGGGSAKSSPEASTPPPRDAKSSSPAPDASSLDSDRGGSPEPYRRAAQAVRGRIADLLPPLLMRSAAAGSPPPASRSPVRPQQHIIAPTANGDGRPQQQQHQQQTNALNRLRDRIVEYERQVLLGEEFADAAPAAPDATDSDAENAEVRRMDRAALINVALPRVVDRFRRVLQVQQQQQPWPAQDAAEVPAAAAAVCERRASSVDGDGRECVLRRRRQHNRTVE